MSAPVPGEPSEQVFEVCIRRRYNSAKLGDRWWWEVLGDHGRLLPHGEFSFGWSHTEASGYRQARRMVNHLRFLRATQLRPAGGTDDRPE